MSPFRSAWLVLLLLLSMRGVDASVDVQAGNSTISGQVVAASGGALGRARVYLVGESPEPVAPTLTDPNGAFAFSSVPPGMYWIRAELEGWLPAYLGQSGFADSVQAIALGPGSTYAGAKVSMLRLAVITGRVLNQFSQPVERADVNAFGEDLLITHTNDLGEFRIPRVLPGNYLVWAIPPFKGDAADASGPAFAGGNPEHRVSVDFGGEVPTGDIITFPASTGTLTGSITLRALSMTLRHQGRSN